MIKTVCQHLTRVVYPGLGLARVCSRCRMWGHHPVLMLLCQGRLSWAQWSRGAGVPPPPLFEFDQVFLCLAKFGVKLQKYWRVDPVPGKINFTHFLTWPALIRALEEWRNFKFGTTQWSGARDKFKVLRFYVRPSREPFHSHCPVKNICVLFKHL